MKSTAPVTVRSGQFEFLKFNTKRDWRDGYHWMLTLSWPHFSAFVFGIYMLINLVFAALFHLGRPCIAEMPPDSFASAFFFSVETLATVGYGHWYPATIYGHIVATLEIMTGMFGLAVITGLIFVRFSRPTARVEFSRELTVVPFNGQPALVLRVANLRHQAMAQVEFRLTLVRNEQVLEGDTMRRFHELRLQPARAIMFPAALTVRHLLDASSPLHGMTPESLERCDARFIASVVGIDTVISAPVQSQADYSWGEVRFGHRFVEIYEELPDGRLTVDYGRLHDTEPVPPEHLAAMNNNRAAAPADSHRPEPSRISGG
ncbi:MAG: ATP-sensitive inward rectifier potassium channel 10 [Verrucomicrobia bacterium]|nr:ATP-sensitive inward rectifier potassium channel 10 [Verrucomicrobiota bacterium]MBV9658435.1 ATP-sensitive inward rectifier potassium channel 10 [Verrucomicrobiota bacterium]